MIPHQAGRRLSLSLLCALLGTVALPAASAQTAAPASVAPAAPARTTPAVTPERAAALARGRQLLTDFYAVRLDALWASFTPEVRAQWGSLTAFRTFRLSGVAQYGAQLELVRERTLTEDGETFYIRSATFEKAPEQVWSLVVGFGADGRVSTFGILLEEDRSGSQVA